MSHNFPEVGTKIFGLFGSGSRGIFIDECVYEEEYKSLWGICYFNTKRDAYIRLQELYERKKYLATN